MSLSLHVLSFLAASGVAVTPLQQQPFPEVATWTPSKVSALTIAQTADKKVAALRHYDCEAILDFEMPQRQGKGHSTNVTQFQDPTRYAITYLAISFVKQSEIEAVNIRTDGKRGLWTQASQKPRKFTPGKLQIAANVKPEDWLIRHNRYVYGAALGETPFANLVRFVQKPANGYIVKVDQRTIRRLNVPYPQYKISIERNAATAKKLGPLRLDAIFDHKLGLPITIASKGQLKGQEPITVVNNLRWKVRRKNFDPGFFTLDGPKPGAPKPTPVKKKASAGR